MCANCSLVLLRATAWVRSNCHCKHVLTDDWRSPISHIYELRQENPRTFETLNLHEKWDIFMLRRRRISTSLDPSIVLRIGVKHMLNEVWFRIVFLEIEWNIKDNGAYLGGWYLGMVKLTYQASGMVPAPPGAFRQPCLVKVSSKHPPSPL